MAAHCAMSFPASAAEVREAAPPLPVARLTRDMVKMRDDAWIEFHDRYFARLFAYALTLHRGDRASAEDTVQSGFLRAVRHIRRFDCEDALWSWLTLLLRCAAADQGRKDAARSRLHEKLVNNADGRPLTQNYPHSNKTTFVLLEEAIIQLPSADRKLLEQKYTAGLSTSELAAEHGVSSKAIESRLRRLRNKLKSKIHALSNQTSP